LANFGIDFNPDLSLSTINQVNFQSKRS